MSITAINTVHAVAPRASERRPQTVVAEMPDMPKPVTPTTAAGYLMQVPSSRVLEALASLQRAMGQQTPAGEAAQRLTKAIAPAASNELDLQA
jgi:hypothetical protein